MEEKEQMKKEKEKQKEERKLKMEKKRAEKAQLAAEKKNAKKTGSRKKVKDAQETTFTPEEIKIFERRLENGYDILTDDRYNLWLKTLNVQSTASLNLSPNEGESSPFIADHADLRHISPQGTLSSRGSLQDDHCWTPVIGLLDETDFYSPLGE